MKSKQERPDIVPRRKMHPNLKDTRSSDPAKARAYAGSARAARRAEEKLSRVWSEKIPDLMGPSTLLYALLECYGPQRRQDLEIFFTDWKLDNIEHRDKLGLVFRGVVNVPGRLERTLFSINPNFPLLKQVRAFLHAILDENDLRFPIAIDDVEREAILRLAKKKRGSFSLEYLLGFPARTNMFSALEVLGGECNPRNLLTFCVPDASPNHIENLTRKHVRDGLLLRIPGGGIAFNADNPITGPLRGLMRAFLRSRPDVAKQIRDLAKSKRVASRNAMRPTLLGTAVLDRILLTLATKGPLNRSALLGSARSKDTYTLRALIESGIVARERRGKEVFVGLNASHPLCNELRDLVLSLSDASAKGALLDAPMANYGLLPLFDARTFKRTKTMPRLRSLMALAFAPRGEIDPTTVKKTLSESLYQTYRHVLRDLRASGIAELRVRKGLKLYRLDPKWPHHGPLLALLYKVGDVWPDEIEPILHSEIVHDGNAWARRRGIEPLRA
ncbi:MAG TPA: hypothetical protein VME66_10225 [Candidatus Acidoferrales bacterium]|nr:hypothetical protein [Candidatus Acidoferrales bacterium]